MSDTSKSVTTPDASPLSSRKILGKPADVMTSSGQWKPADVMTSSGQWKPADAMTGSGQWKRGSSLASVGSSTSSLSHQGSV